MDLNLNYISPLPVTVVNFLHQLSCHEKVNRLIIFGSRACGDYDKYSDIDLAIDAKRFNREEWITVMGSVTNENHLGLSPTPLKPASLGLQIK